MSVFKLKEYNLPLKGKKRKPICVPCKKGFKRWGEYNAHLVEKHGGKLEYKCEEEGCGKVLGTWLGFTSLMMLHNEDKKRFVCSVCQK